MRSNADKQRFLNFPIAMIKGLYSGFGLTDPDEVRQMRKETLYNILCVSIYYHSEKVKKKAEFKESEFKRFQRSAEYLGFSFTQKSDYDYSRELFGFYENNRVIVGLNTDVFWEFYLQDKDLIEWQCLTAYLAFKSIVGRRKYVKTDNALLLSRMTGMERKVKSDERLNLTRYQLDKIKNELQLNWNVKYYSRYTRGFYFGFDISIKDLILEAETKRKKLRLEKLNEEKNKALEAAKMSLMESAP